MTILILFILLVLLQAAPVSAAKLPTVPTLESRLEAQIQAMVNAGHLRPAYTLAHNMISRNFAYVTKTTTADVNEFDDVFHNPADTLYTLSMAYPHLSTAIKSQVLAYIDQYYGCRTTNPPQYSVCTVTHIGTSGAYREYNPVPENLPLSGNNISGYTLNTGPLEPAWEGWTFNPFNFYALYRYAKITANPAATAAIILTVLRSTTHPAPGALPSTEFLALRPHVLNIYIAGYYGYLGLIQLANDPANTTAIQSNLSTAQQLRIQQLPRPLSATPTPFPTTSAGYLYEFPDPININLIHQSTLEAGGFLWLVPELGTYLYENAYTDIQWVVDNYNQIKPYWSVPRIDEDMRIRQLYNEGTISHIYDTSSLFLAKAFALKQSQTELEKYLESPGYPVGDLFYIQNLAATIGAGNGTNPEPTSPQTTPSPTTTIRKTGDANGDNRVDGLDYVIWLNHYGGISTGVTNGDFNSDNRVDGLDYVVWLNNYGS